jgi:hypothetical protein
MGSNSTFSVAAWPGFNVAGKAIPETVKPAPIRAAALIVTGTVPVEVKVTDCGAVAVFTKTLPKAILVALTLSVGDAAFSCKLKVSDTPPAVAVSATICAVLTEDAVAVNPALVAPAGTVTADGTVIALLLLARLTVMPPVPAAAFRVTVQESAPAPNKATLVQLNELKFVAPEAAPVPLRLITAELPVEELLVTANCPVAAPAAAGEKLTLKL